MATEYESEREAIATLYDFRLTFKNSAVQNGKKDFTLDEVLDFIDSFAEKRKIQK